MADKRWRSEEGETDAPGRAPGLTDISGRRKGLYYAGNALIAVGFVLFLSVFVTGCMQFGDFRNFDENARSSMGRAIGGMALIVVGGLIAKVGARGAAGSGLLLDPKRAREDLAPYARMTGGLLKDTLEEADVDLGRRAPTEVVKVKCRACDKLNEVDSKYCQECGQPL